MTRGTVWTVLVSGSVVVAGFPGGVRQARADAVPSLVAPADTGVRHRLVLAPEGNQARYRVTEQLVGFDLPNDAVGVTDAIRGILVLDPAGRVIRDESKFVVDLTTLKSDRDRRDRYIQRRTLETEQFPIVELVPTELRGLPTPLPASGAWTFELVGDLTVRGITRPTVWQVTVRAENGGFVGRAATSFAFGDFGMTRPRVAAVLSVEDNIRLEYDFRLVPDPSDRP